MSFLLLLLKGMSVFSYGFLLQVVEVILQVTKGLFYRRIFQSHSPRFLIVFGVYEHPLIDTFHFALKNLQESMVLILNAQLIPLKWGKALQGKVHYKVIPGKLSMSWLPPNWWKYTGKNDREVGAD